MKRRRRSDIVMKVMVAEVEFVIRWRKEKREVMVLWMSWLKMKERTRTPAFMVAERMFLSSKVVLCCRDIISVNLGCLNVPGEGVGSATLARGVEGVVPGVGVFCTILLGVAWDNACEEFETSAVEIVDMVPTGGVELPWVSGCDLKHGAG
jgi:hypothetical protein